MHVFAFLNLVFKSYIITMCLRALRQALVGKAYLSASTNISSQNKCRSKFKKMLVSLLHNDVLMLAELTLMIKSLILMHLVSLFVLKVDPTFCDSQGFEKCVPFCFFEKEEL